MKRNKDLRKFFGKKLKDTVTGVVGTCTGSANYLGGDDMVLLAYRDSTGAANEGWYLFRAGVRWLGEAEDTARGLRCAGGEAEERTG